MRRTVSSVAILVLVLGSLVGCTKDPAPDPTPAAEVPQPNVNPRGPVIEVAVTAMTSVDVAVPGVGHVVGGPGTFTTSGTMRVQPLQSDGSSSELVVTSSVGLDVDFEGTRLAKPLTVVFDDPAARDVLPPGALPIILHKPDSGFWELKALAQNKLGVPVLETSEFSFNLFGWISIPDWLRSAGDSIADAVTQRTDPRPCPRAKAPPWSSTNQATTLVHLCSTTNTDSNGTARAEIQVQSNRRFLMWTDVPAGFDYVWVDGFPDPVRKKLNSIMGVDPNRVLLMGNGWFTAGYRQLASGQSLAFDATIDSWSAGLTVVLNVMGLDLKEGVYGALMLVKKCVVKLLPKPSWEKGKSFLACVVEQSLSNLVNPDKAYATAMDFYGEAAYAKSAESALSKSIGRLRLFGKILRLNLVGVIVGTYSQLPDLFSEWGKDHPGRFTLKLAGKPPAPSSPSGGGGTGGGGGTPQGGGTASNPRITFSQGAAAPQGWWYNTTLSGFAAGSSITVTCRDSIDPGGFWTQTFVVDGSGRATDTTLCYSADGPDHWITAPGVESNHITWGSVPPPPPPPPAPARIELARGGSAPSGYWYSVTLSGFAAGSAVIVTCRDSVDPGGFWTQTFTIGGDGRAGDSTLCYSGDHPDHWVTAPGVESNHVSW